MVHPVAVELRMAQAWMRTCVETDSIQSDGVGLIERAPGCCGTSHGTGMDALVCVETDSI